MASLLILALIVIVLSAVFSMTEAALFSYSVTKARVAAQRGNRLAKNAIELRAKPLKAVAALVILSSINQTAGSLAIGWQAGRTFSDFGIGAFTTILTFTTIIFAEIIPKNFGESWSQTIFPIVAYPLRWFALALSPLTFILEVITKPFTTGESPFITSEDEIALLTRVGASEGTIEPHEADMIQRVFRLNDVTASDMMTPRPFADFIDGSKKLSEIADVIKSTRHSRLPVFEGDAHNITGIVHQRDLLRALADGEGENKVSEYASEALLIPESRLADDLLRDFQEKRSHLAVVLSEYGNVIGVVGLEDVVEELVGEIIDEKDVAPELIKRISKNEIIAHGQTRIAHINHFFNTTIHSQKTLNGFLMDKFGRIPEKNATIEYDGLTFQIDELGPRQIDRVRISKQS
jgi:CBS domain containing-hemolysin-like protein